EDSCGSAARGRTGRRGCVTASRDVVAQEVAPNAAVEERHLSGRPQAHLSRQCRIAREYKHAPTRATRAKYLSHRTVEFLEVLLPAEALAVGRVAKKHAGQARRRLEVAHVFHIESEQVSDARGAGGRAGQRHGIGPDVRAENRKIQRLLDARAGAI